MQAIFLLINHLNRFEAHLNLFKKRALFAALKPMDWYVLA